MFTYFPFGVLHYHGRESCRGCQIEQRKAFLERVIKAAACPCVLSVSHVIGKDGAGAWRPAGRVSSGVGKAMLDRLSPLREGEAVRGRVAVAPEIEVRCVTSGDTGTG